MTSWQAAPADGAGVYVTLDPRDFNASFALGLWNQTVRTVISPHTAGDAVRIKLSNRFGGGRPLVVKATTIAEQATGRSVVAATMTPITFSGKRGVTIPSGQDLVSDPVAFRSRPFTNLAVSVALGAPPPRPTTHPYGFQTSYVSPVGSGDHTGSVDGTPLRQRTPMRFFLTEVHVRGNPRAQTLVAIGDSITDGFTSRSGVDLNMRWPDILQRRLLRAGSSITVANAGISSNRIRSQRMFPFPFGGPPVRSRFDDDALNAPTLGGIILAIGTNDIGPGSLGAQPLISEYREIAQRAHAAGVPIFIATITPTQGFFPHGLPKNRRTRNEVNTWIRTQRDFDGVIEFARAVEDPSNPERLAKANDSRDHIHPSPAGYEAMANAIDIPALRQAMRYPD